MHMTVDSSSNYSLIADRLYLILAIFYDKAANSHATDSLMYELDLQTKKANTIQPIATDGAKALHVFRIVDIGIHMLIGCVKGKAESLLFRFNPDTRQVRIHIIQSYIVNRTPIHFICVSCERCAC